MATGTMGLVTPPPAEMPASHAFSRGAPGADDAVDAAGVGFTAKLVRFGTNGAAFLFTPGVGGVDRCNNLWCPPPHDRHLIPFEHSAAL